MLVVDNVSSSRQSLALMTYAKENFSYIVAITHSDIFFTYFLDEPGFVQLSHS